MRESTSHLVSRPTVRIRRTSARIGVNLTAMIDVTFLLLVYFMVATDFKVGEEIYRLDLPERGGSATVTDPFDLDDSPLKIFVSTTGRGVESYSIRFEGPYDQPTTFDSMRDSLVSWQINENNTAGLFEPDHPIVVEPTRTTSWEHVVATFNSIAQARYTNVSFGAAR